MKIAITVSGSIIRFLLTKTGFFSIVCRQELEKIRA
jgi:hypothetical protein